MAVNKRISFQKAIEMTENALAEVNRLAMEQIRLGADTSQHVESAERELRDALRQLVFAERESTNHSNREAPPDTHDPQA